MSCFSRFRLLGATLLASRRPASCPVVVWAGCILLGTVGCQQRVTSKLLGEWVGRPDTAAAQAARELEKFSAGSAAAAEEEVAGNPNESTRVTDWEHYDVTIHFNFVSSDRLEMSLAGGEQPKSGSWQVVSRSPTGCAIDVITESGGAGDEKPTVERRRFELLLDEREGTCIGFLLTEAGADPQLGAVYFQRPQLSDVTDSEQ